MSSYNFLETGSKLKPQQVRSIFACLPVFTSFLRLQSYRNHGKEILGNFKSLVKVALAVLKEIIIFWKFLKWYHKLVRDCKRGKLVSYFVNNAAKTCLYGLDISENIEIEHVFQSLQSCLSAIKMQLLPQVFSL